MAEDTWKLKMQGHSYRLEVKDPPQWSTLECNHLCMGRGEE